MAFDPRQIKMQIDQLLVQFPDMEDDEVLRADMIEGATDLHEFLRATERKRQDAISMAEAIALNVENLRARKARFERRDEAIRALMFKPARGGQLEEG